MALIDIAKSLNISNTCSITSASAPVLLKSAMQDRKTHHESEPDTADYSPALAGFATQSAKCLTNHIKDTRDMLRPYLNLHGLHVYGTAIVLDEKSTARHAPPVSQKLDLCELLLIHVLVRFLLPGAAQPRPCPSMGEHKEWPK